MKLLSIFGFSSIEIQMLKNFYKDPITWLLFIAQGGLFYIILSTLRG